ncbi:hypothetical protein H310_06557 [Aphanomyces invadans]|uniref:Uncharacterized protein n=1 Tax=Aphanomyces invadans TaxID=157072 RepID=A0A024U3V3_9STRA|nr:hypothetical protein H310_06557 [Aphanomyces invadans]ETW00894.1 hypothetical protein H310_06557 [Aphanomyces invadans]|eukprot:XP_008869892.1 hypothetical protein H310_06557 [Aphanomyces invadans]
MAAIQAYTNALEHNYTGKHYFDVSKNRSNKRIYGTAKDIVHDALPIQCLEDRHALNLNVFELVMLTLPCFVH